MRVEFSFTQDDLVDASRRFLARSKTIRTWCLRGMFATAVLLFLIFFAWLYREPLKGAVVGLFAAGVGTLLYPRFYKSGMEKRIRKLNRELFGDQPSFVCSVELNESGF